MAETTKFELRGLTSKDVFRVSNILKKIGIAELKGVFNVDNASGDVTEIGIDVFVGIADVVLGNLHKCEQDIYEFAGSVAGMQAAEVEQLPIADFAELIVAIINKPDFADFIKVVSTLFK